VADTLSQLRDALRARDKAKTQLRALESQLSTGVAENRTRQAELEKLTSKTSSKDSNVSRRRESLAHEMEASRSVISAAEDELRGLNERHDAGEVSDRAYGRAVPAIRARIAGAEARIQMREKALAAESAKELDWLDKLTIAQRRADVPPQTDGRSTDWPGASVPERIMMLWRESKKPQSRRPIVISSIVVGVLALIVIAVVLVGGATSDTTMEDYLGRGEVLVPVLVQDMEGVRSLEFTLQYDPQLLTGMSVIQDEVGRLSVMQYDIDRDGRLRVSVRDVTGITGTGSLIIIRFKVNELVEEQAPMEFISVAATDVQTLQPRPAQGENGWVNTSTLEVYAPVLRFPDA
jgi:hypothetical protein